MGFFKPPQPQALATPAAPPNPPMFGQDSAQKKPKAKSMNQTFLGADTTPSAGQRGTNTLLGQT